MTIQTATLAAVALWLIGLPAAEAQPQRLNLAKLQTAVSDSAAAGSPALLATDGVVGNANSWVSRGTGPHWLTITLPVAVQLGSAQLFLGNDDTLPVANFSLQSFNSNAWTTIPGASFSGNSATVLNVVFSAPVTTSQVRFYSTDSTVTVREIALYGTNGPLGYPIGTDVGLNLGKQCPVIASSVAGTNYALLAVDGYAGTNSGWQTANVNGPHTLEVDFPVAARIGSAHIYSGSATYPAISSFTLNYWTGSAWAAIPGATVGGNTQKQLVVSFASPVSTTKVQLAIPGNGTQFLRELAVFPAGTGITSYPLWTDVVSNEPATTQWETYGDGFWSLINGANSNALVVSATGASLAAPDAADKAQQFQILYNLDSDTFRLRHRSTWQCLAAQNAAISPGTAVVEEPVYCAMPHELWRLQDVGGGYCRVVNVWNGMILQSDGQTPATVTLAAPSADMRQQWQPTLRAIYPKKGVAGNEANWARFGASWDYNWSRNPSMPSPAQVVFLPQQWNGAAVSALPQYAPGWHTNPKPMALLGFNEPDRTDQANMTTASAISLWPQLQAANVPLVGPATSWPLTSWMTNFWSLANSAGYRIDESGFHWYSYPSVDTLMGNLQSVYNAWGRPIWITEFGAAFSSGTWTEEMNYNFLAEFLWRAEGLACLHRYGVFCFNQDPPANTWDQVSPISGVFKSDGITLTAFGELYAAWDGDCAIHTNAPYILHNKGASYRISNISAAAPGIANIRTNDLTVQWQLLPAPTANRCYIVSLADGRPLSWNGGALTLAAAGTTGPAVEWTYTANVNGYFFIDNPATAQRLSLNRSNDGTGKPVVTNLTMAAAGTVNDYTRWRFIKPYQPVPLGLSAVPGNRQAALSWNAVAGAISYNLKRATVSGGPYTNIASGITANNYTNTGLVNNTIYYYVVSAVLATGETANSAEAAVIPGGVAVNAGGSAAGWFSADAGFAGGTASSTTSTIDLSGLISPAPHAVYQSSRYGSSSYTIANLTPNATYWVRLHFAESYWTATGKRVFNVSVNGASVLNSFDIFAAAGAQNKATIREFYMSANSSGQMVIQFTTVTDNAQINGIEVLPPSPLIPAGLWAAGDKGEVWLSWPASAGAVSYNVYRSTTSGGPYSMVSTPGSVTNTAFTDFAVSGGTMYYYVVTAMNPFGESGRSSEAAALVPCLPPVTISLRPSTNGFSVPAILTVFDLGGLLDPVKVMVTKILDILPNLFAAFLIGFAGWLLGKILAGLVTNILAAAGADQGAHRIGLDPTLRISQIIGTIVLIFVFVPALIAALDALKIEAISRPATDMLGKMLAAVPNIVAAALILVVTYYVAKFAAGLLGRLLNSMGLDTVPEKLGLAGIFAGGAQLSQLVSMLVLFFAMLFATVEAANRLEFTQVRDVVTLFIKLGGDIVLGATILLIGFWLANLAHSAIRRADTTNSESLATIARVAILGLVIAMGLRAMGIADDIVNLAFLLAFGAIAVAVALSFGLGGREAAGKQMEYWLEKFRRDD